MFGAKRNCRGVGPNFQIDPQIFLNKGGHGSIFTTELFLMSSRRHIKKTEEKTDINISPMIDMVFILLIFFIVTTVFVDERGFEASKPEDAQDQEDQKEPIIFRILANGEITQGRSGENIGIAGVNRVIRNNMTEEDLSVIIQVEKGAKADVAVRVFDESLRAGASAVNLKEAR